jgi:hypothetical protein
MKVTRIFEKLVNKALTRNIVGHPDYMKVEKALKNGEEIPDSCLPGRLLYSLTDEERKELEKLKSDDIKNIRPDAI